MLQSVWKHVVVVRGVSEAPSAGQRAGHTTDQHLMLPFCMAVGGTVGESGGFGYRKTEVLG